MDFEALASRLGIDMEDFLELAQLFYTTTKADMEKIHSSMKGNSPEDAAAAAHSIKGAAGNLGFEEMASLAKKMEFKGKEGSFDGFEGWMDEMDRLLDRLKEEI
ncbi:MAG: Hpt domain-containing protein [Desulfobacter sp.]|nr:MAG: Hpt domain-containing protein [Desulfobacter sp.]